MTAPSAFIVIGSRPARDDICRAAEPHLVLKGVFAAPSTFIERLADPVDLIIADLDALRSIARWQRQRSTSRGRESPAVILALADEELRDALGLLHLCRGILFWQRDLDKIGRLIVITLEGYSGVPPDLLPDLITDRVRISLIDRLTPTERHTLGLLGQALSNRSIARSLSVPEPVAKSLVRTVLTKLRLRNRTEAAVFAVRWYGPDSPPPDNANLPFSPEHVTS